MSSKVSEKTSDAKVTVSSDSDDDDDTSSSSLLSSSAPSEDGSDVETVTFSVPLPPQDNKAKHAESGKKESTSNDSKKPEQDLNKVVKIEKPGVATKSSLSPSKTEVAEKTGTSSKVLSGLKKFEKTDEPKVTMATAANTQRSISPKIVVNDVGTADDKTGAKISADITKKIRDNNSPKKTASETSHADLSCSASPAKTLNSIERSKSPQKPESKVETEPTKSVRKNTGGISTLDAGQKSSPRVSPSRKTPEELGGGNSKSSQGEKEPERSKSPKKTPEEKEISREKSPKKASTVDSKEAVRDNKSKETVPVEAKNKPDKESTKALDDITRTEKSPKTKLETNQEKPETETTKVKPIKTKTRKQEDDDVRDDAALAKNRVTQVENGSKGVDTVLQNKASTSLQYNGLAQDFNEENKRELNPERQGKESGHNVGENLDVRNTKDSELNKKFESGNDVVNLTTPETGRTGKKTPNKAEIGSDGVDSDTSSPSKSSNDLKTTENTKELVNEDSEFTYRRKSMDDFIKRILAEAREEKLKKEQGIKGETPAGGKEEEEEEERGRHTEGYKEQNGGMSSETPGLPPKWSRSEAKDKEASNLDKRLANIEKRRYGDNDSVKGGSLKVKGEGGGEESAVKKKPLQNDVNDFDFNLEDDLKEINKYLQSRKTTTATRFDYDDDDDDGLENESATSSSTTGKQRRWLLTDGGDQTIQPEADDSILMKSQPRKKLTNADPLDLDNDDDDRILARFKRERERERDLVLPEALFAPRRRDVTDNVIRERTRSVRGLIDGQTDVVQSFKSSSKGLEDLEREIRVVRQVCLDRQVRIEALDGALNAEFRAYENDHLAACERLNATADFITAQRDDYGGRLRRQGRLPSLESLGEDSFPARRRSVCAPGSGSSGPASRSSDLGLDLPDLRPSRQQRGSDSRGSEPDYQPVDPRRRAGSVSRDWTAADPPGLDDPGLQLAQRPARTRASIATSNPTADYTDTASSDNFLARIRAKYSFLAPSVDNSGYSGSTRSSRGSASSGYGTGSLLSATSDFKYTRPRSGISEDTKLRSRDFLTTSPLSYSSYGTPSYYSVRDSRSPTGLGVTTMDRGRRVQSVADSFSFDRPTGAGVGSEFQSRFLDKVRGKKAMGEEAPAATKGGQEKPFKSRFLKGSPAGAASARPDRGTEGGGGAEAEAEGGGERPEVTE